MLSIVFSGAGKKGRISGTEFFGINLNCCRQRRLAVQQASQRDLSYHKVKERTQRKRLRKVAVERQETIVSEIAKALNLNPTQTELESIVLNTRVSETDVKRIRLEYL